MAISTITENHVRSGQVCSKNCDLTKTIIILTAIAIPIITTVFAYVGAFKFLKLQVINPKFTFALKIIVPATLGFGIVLTEIFISVCIFSANKQQNNLPSDDEFQALVSNENESEEEREIRECGSGFLKFLSIQTIKGIPVEQREKIRSKLPFLKTITDRSIMKGSYGYGNNRSIFIAMKLDVFDYYTGDHVAIITEILYQTLYGENIYCVDSCSLEKPRKGEKQKFKYISSVLQGDRSLKYDTPLHDLSFCGAGFEDIRNLINREEITIMCKDQLRKKLNPNYYSDSEGQTHLLKLRLHNTQIFEKIDEEEKIKFMLENAQINKLFLIKLNTENFDNLFLFRFLILELNL